MTDTTPTPATAARTKRLRARRILYARALLEHGGFHHGDAQVRSLVAVMAGEGSHAHWNPLDTTLPRPGATPYNNIPGGIHVWNYPDAHTGVQATIATMQQSNMGAWAEQLRNPNATAQQICAAFSRVPWAYIGDVLPEHLVEDWATNHAAYKRAYSVPIDGPGGWPYGSGE